MIIGLMGPKGSGKDTCADYLCANHGFIKVSLADCLKRACKELFLFSDEQLFGTQEQKETPDPRWFGASPRKVLQFVGTELLRDNMDKIMPGIGKNIFTHHLKLWYEEEKKKNPAIRVVLADVRFQNEVDFVKELGGRVIKIDRPSVAVSGDLHASEVEMQKITNYDSLLKNNHEGDLESLYSELVRIVLNQ